MLAVALKSQFIFIFFFIFLFQITSMDPWTMIFGGEQYFNQKIYPESFFTQMAILDFWQPYLFLILYVYHYLYAPAKGCPREFVPKLNIYLFVKYVPLDSNIMLRDLCPVSKYQFQKHLIFSTEKKQKMPIFYCDLYFSIIFSLFSQMSYFFFNCNFLFFLGVFCFGGRKSNVSKIDLYLLGTSLGVFFAILWYIFNIQFSEVFICSPFRSEPGKHYSAFTVSNKNQPDIIY